MQRATLAALFLVVAFLRIAALAQEPTAPPAVHEAYWPTHGWRSSTPEAQGMDSEVLAQAFDYIRQHQTPIHSLLIVRNGYVVLDAYFYPFREGQVHDGASMTKSITSTLIGIAIGRARAQRRAPACAFTFSRTEHWQPRPAKGQDHHRAPLDHDLRPGLPF